MIIDPRRSIGIDDHVRNSALGRVSTVLEYSYQHFMPDLGRAHAVKPCAVYHWFALPLPLLGKLLVVHYSSTRTC